MGHLKSMDLPELDRSEAGRAQASGQSRAWIWLVVAALGIGGFLYYRSSHSKNPQNSAAAPAGGPATGKGGRGGGNFTGPVGVAAATQGDLPVYLNVPWTVPP